MSSDEFKKEKIGLGMAIVKGLIPFKLAPAPDIVKKSVWQRE